MINIIQMKEKLIEIQNYIYDYLHKQVSPKELVVLLTTLVLIGVVLSITYEFYERFEEKKRRKNKV